MSECEEAEKAADGSEYCRGEAEGTGEEIFQTGVEGRRDIHQSTFLLDGR